MDETHLWYLLDVFYVTTFYLPYHLLNYNYEYVDKLYYSNCIKKHSSSFIQVIPPGSPVVFLVRLDPQKSEHFHTIWLQSQNILEIIRPINPGIYAKFGKDLQKKYIYKLQSLLWILKQFRKQEYHYGKFYTTTLVSWRNLEQVSWTILRFLFTNSYAFNFTIQWKTFLYYIFL